MAIRFKLPGFTSPITRADTPTPGGFHQTTPPGQALSPPRTTYAPKEYGDLVKLPGTTMRPLSISARDGLAHELSAEIWNILVQEVMICHQDGTPQHDDLFDCLTSYQKRFYNENMQLPRLQRIHQLLCGWRSPSDVFVIENGPGCHASSAITLAAMGSRVLVKQPIENDFYANFNALHQEVVDKHCPTEARSRIAYASTMEEIDVSTPADIVYCSSPDYGLVNYLGRDVLTGGYLVLQTECDLDIDAKQWRKIFYAPIGGDLWLYIRGLVLPGNALHVRHNFIVLQRRRTQ